MIPGARARSIAITGVTPEPAVTNRIFCGGGLGSEKSPLGAARRITVPGETPSTRWLERKPSGLALMVTEITLASPAIEVRE